MLSIFICSNWIHATQYEVGSSKKLINLKIKNGIILPCSDLFVIYKIPLSSLRFRWILCAIYTEIVIASHIIIDAHNVEKCVCNQPTIANHTTCLKSLSVYPFICSVNFSGLRLIPEEPRTNSNFLFYKVFWPVAVILNSWVTYSGPHLFPTGSV